MNRKTQIQMSAMLAQGFSFAIQLLGVVLTAIAVTWSLITEQCASQVYRPALADGPSPTAQQTSNMPQARTVIYYNSIFMQWLYTNFNKMMLCSMQTLPTKSGQTVRNFMSITLGPDVVQQTEGTIGPPEQIQVNWKDIVIGQWANYTNISDLAMLTSISNDLVEYKKLLAYQLGWTIDDLVMQMLDYLRVLDSRTSNQDATTTPFSFTKNIIEQMPASLAGAGVPPMKNGFYNGSIHNFLIGDIWLDNSNNSVVDIWKHTEVGQAKLEGLSDTDEGQAPARILELAGAHWRPSNNQTQTANWQGSGNTGLSTYLAGANAMQFVEFPNPRHTKLDPKWQNMNLWSGEYQQHTAFDPNGLIAAGAGYNCVLGIGPPPDTTSRARIAITVPQTS